MSVPPGRPEPVNSTLLLVGGILSLAGLWFLGPIAWIVGNMALRKIKNGAGDERDRANTLIGRNCGIVSTALVCISVPIYFAIFYPMVKLVSSLTPDMTDSTGNQTAGNGAESTASHDFALAIIANDVTTVKSDLATDPTLANKKNSTGETPLFSAAFYGDKAIVALLIKCGANVNVHDNFGKTPLDKAKSGNQATVVAFLESHGAKIGNGNKSTVSSDQPK